MPQLNIETYVSQYFWFISILFAFYYIAISQVIPRIASIMKTREKSTESVGITHNEIVDISTASNIYRNISKNVSTEIHTTKDQELKTLKKVSESWVKKHI